MGVNDLKMLEALFAANPSPQALLSGPELIFRMANPAYHSLLVNPQREIIGQPFTAVWPDALSADLRQHLRQVLETGQPFDAERLALPDAQGANRSFAVRARPLPWQGEPGVLLALWAVAAAKPLGREEMSAEDANRRAAELNAVLDALPEAIVIYDEQGQVIAVNPAARKLVGFDPLAMDRKQVLERLDIQRPDGRRVPITELPAAQALKGHATRTQRLVVRAQSAAPLHVLSSASPLLIDNQLAGAVAVWSDISELIQRRQEMEALVQVAGALRNTLIEEEMFPAALNQIVELLNAEGASIVMPDAATGEMVVRGVAGNWGYTIGERLSPGEGISAHVLLSGEPYVNNDIQKDPVLVTTVFPAGLQCGACVPLKVQENSIGVLWLGRDTPITNDEVHLLSAIADMAASNLYRARLFDQTQLRFQRLSALHSIDMAITSSLDLHLTLSVLLDQIVSQMGVDAADILLYDQALHWLEFSSGRGFVLSPPRVDHLSLTDTPAGQVALERRMLTIPDLLNTDIPTENWIAPQEGFRAYFAAPLISKSQVKGVLELYRREVFHPDDEWLAFLETLATQAAIALDSAELFNRLQRTNDELRQAYDATIEGWSHALELRDHETEGHSRRVTEMTVRLARSMRISDEDIANYRRGVLLHDIGKMAIPDEILLKSGPLTPDEQAIMRRHPEYAYNLLKPIAYLRPALDIPYAHHEWWDGRGYPRGLKGEEIPLSARIFAVVDVYDALTNERTYRPPWPEQKVIEYIHARSGSQFDPRVVEAFLNLMRSKGRFFLSS